MQRLILLVELSRQSALSGSVLELGLEPAIPIAVGWRHRERMI